MKFSFMKDKVPLPIDPYLPAIIKEHLEHPLIFIQASPGSGKTTRVPWEIFSKTNRKTIILIPRKLPTKLAAERVALENNSNIGEEIGYKFRFESKISHKTKFIFMTEGTFVQMLNDIAFRDELETVILDEFHERNLETDFAFALLKNLQENNEKIKIIIMSATLDMNLLGKHPQFKFINVETKFYDVKIHYLENTPSALNTPPHLHILKFLKQYYKNDGNVLIFCPGMKEILDLKEKLKNIYPNISTLHSEKIDQDCINGKTEGIIISTNITESSVTIPNLRVVIDSGIQRTLSYSPWSGLSILEDQKTSQASSIQRAARAGRTQDGYCLRLFSEFDFNQRSKAKTPDVETSDLTEIFLKTKILKINPSWPTPPRKTNWENAKKLLQLLGAIDEDENPTTLGVELNKIPFHPRIGICILLAKKYSQKTQKKIVKFITELLNLEKDPRQLHTLNSYFDFTNNKPDCEFEKIILSGFIDQISKYRKKQNDFIHFSGEIIKSKKEYDLKDNELVIILEVSKNKVAQKILPVTEDWLYDITPFPLEEETSYEFNNDKFKELKTIRVGRIALYEEEKNLKLTEAVKIDHLKDTAVNRIKKEITSILESSTFERIQFGLLESQTLNLGEISNKKIETFLENLEDLNQKSIEDFLFYEISQIVDLNNLARNFPEKITLQNSKTLNIKYHKSGIPKIECQIQDLYGVDDTPYINQGKLRLNLVILGPHKRPLQITNDLKGFWDKTYPGISKELEREYPRHYWSKTPKTDLPIFLKRQLKIKS
jgi:ATP-dependent helicase HrpB